MQRVRWYGHASRLLSARPTPAIQDHDMVTQDLRDDNHYKRNDNDYKRFKIFIIIMQTSQTGIYYCSCTTFLMTVGSSAMRLDLGSVERVQLW